MDYFPQPTFVAPNGAYRLMDVDNLIFAPAEETVYPDTLKRLH